MKKRWIQLSMCVVLATSSGCLKANLENAADPSQEGGATPINILEVLGILPTGGSGGSGDSSSSGSATCVIGSDKVGSCTL